METTRRAIMTGAAAVAVTAALPVPSVSMEHLVWRLPVANIEGGDAEFAAALERGEPVERVTSFFGRSLYLLREELRLFDRGEGVWRDLYRLPMVPGAFSGSAVELESYRALPCEPCATAA